MKQHFWHYLAAKIECRKCGHLLEQSRDSEGRKYVYCIHRECDFYHCAYDAPTISLTVAECVKNGQGCPNGKDCTLDHSKGEVF